MKLLIFGGTKFVGRHIAETALVAGHEVALFHRGQTGSELVPEAEHILGDRDGGLSAIGNREFDAVIDVSGYLPRLVGDAVAFAAGRAPHYTFISTISVYDGTGLTEVDEETPLLTPPAPEIEAVTSETYGGLKVACEQAVLMGFPGASIVRPGLVGGPHDHTKRFDLWVQAALKGGELEIPARSTQPIQLVDGRDLAAFTLSLTERKVGGIFNATGTQSSWGELAGYLRLLNPEASITVTDTADAGMPMVIGDPADEALLRCSHRRAEGEGFTPRSLAEMTADAPNWPQNQ